VGYQRLKGKKTLFPFGFHCTGMPIKVRLPAQHPASAPAWAHAPVFPRRPCVQACADKLKYELATFGNPPEFPEEGVSARVRTAHGTITLTRCPLSPPAPLVKGDKTEVKHAKVAAKTGGVKWQWMIMQNNDIPDEEIPA
jgi:leucyl-tRNA synthetase